MQYIFFILLIPLISQAHITESVTCTDANIPDGKTDKYILFRMDSSSALLNWKKNPKGETREALLAKDLECMPAKSDFRVVSCIRPAAEGSKRVSDASLTLIKHSYLSAGSVRDNSGELKDALSESFKLYFRDDRVNKEISKNFLLAQCRASQNWELEWAKALIGKN